MAQPAFEPTHPPLPRPAPGMTRADRAAVVQAALASVSAHTPDRGRAVHGALWLVHLDAAGTPRLTSPVEEGARCIDELFLRDLRDVIVRTGLPQVVVVVARAGGRPTRPDRVLRAELAARLAGTPSTLVDVAVVPAADPRPA